MNIFNNNIEEITYYINDKNKNKRWIFPTNLETPTFLNLYNTNSWKGNLYKILVKIVFKLKLQKYFVSGTMKGDLEIKYKKIIEELECDNYSIFTGTVGENRKQIIEVNKNNTTKYFIKIPTTPSAEKLVMNEKKNIKYLEQFNFQVFNYPKNMNDYDDVIVLSNIKPKYIVKDNGFSSIHFLALGELYTNISKNSPISKIELFQSSIEYIDYLDKTNKLGINLLKVQKFLISKETDIVVSFAHCDFTPWNMYLTDNKLYIYDWELANQNTPILFDFFHYIFQEGVLIKHQSYQEIKNELKVFLNNKELKMIIQKNKIDFNEYYSYYLYINISYYALKYQNQKDLHMQGYWLIDVWNDALKDLIIKKGKVFELI
jgi:hypothetical protein